MKIILPAALLIAGLTVAGGLPAQAQTSTQTKVSQDTKVDNGVATHTTMVEHVTKRKTSRPRKILGVKVGHKTVTSKTVRETSTSSNGNASTTVKTSH